MYAKPVGLVTSVLHTDMSESVHPPGTVSSKHVDELYTPFVSNGFVSLDGQGMVPVKILRDSGANQSLILSSVLPFSAHTATGGKAPVLGVGMVTLWVPVHRVHLDSDLVCGEVLPSVLSCRYRGLMSSWAMIWQAQRSGKRVHHLCMWVQFCRCLKSLRGVLKRALKCFPPVL